MPFVKVKTCSKAILTFCIVFSISLLLQSCKKHPELEPVSVTVTNKPYIKAMYFLPLTYDPAQMNDTASLVAANLIYDGLLGFTPDLEIKDALAKSWNTSRDGKTITFKLKKAQFHDGTPVTSSDVKRSLEHNVASKSKVYSYYDCIVGASEYHQEKTKEVSGIIVKSDSELEIKLLYPFPPFLSVLAGATAKVLPKNIDFNHPIGSGPFIFSKIEKRENYSDVVLTRNNNYYEEPAKLETLILRFAVENIAREQAKQGLIDDLANYPLNGQEEVFKYGKDTEAPVAATWIIGLNTRLAPFKSESNRMSFKDSIDHEAFRKKFHPDALPANGYIPSGLPGYEREYVNTFKHHAVSPSAQPKDLIRIAIPQELSNAPQMKEMLDTQLKSNGWNAEVVLTAWDKLMEGYSNKTLQAFLVSMNMDYPDTEFLVRNFESNNPDNFSGIHDAKIDSLIRKARATQDRSSRHLIYKQLVQLLNEKAVTVNLFHPRGHYWTSPCVRGFVPNILSDVYIDYKNISFDSTCLKSNKSITENLNAKPYSG